VRRVAFGPDGTALTVDRGGNARWWQWKNAKILADGSGAQTDAGAGRKAGWFLAVARPDKLGVVRVWNQDQVRDAFSNDSGIASAVSSPDGNLVVVVYSGGTFATLWDRARGRKIDLKHNDSVYSADFNRGGNLIVTASKDKTARVWNTAGGLVHELKGHSDEVNRASFSPTSDLIATTSDDNTARIWTWPKGRTLILRGHDGPVYDAMFNFDGRFLLTASRDRSAKIWQTTSGELIETFTNLISPGLYSASVAFNPASTRVMVSIEDGRNDRIRIYPCELCGSLDELRSLARMRVTRPLTQEEREQHLRAPNR
jgi:WD40 repeat protein